MDFPSVQTLPTMLLGYLRGKIISGQFPAGQKIHENDLASQLNLSRGPLREAFRILEQEHLVVNLPRRGTYVTKLSVQDLEEIYQVRRMIECTAIDLLEAKGITHLPSVAAALEEAQSLQWARPDAHEEFLVYREKITDFHTRLVMEAHNSRLSHYYQTLYFSLARYQYLHIRQNLPGSFERTTDAHRRALTLLSTGRYKEAKASLLEHLEYAQRTQMELLPP